MILVIDAEQLKTDIMLAGYSITGFAKDIGCSKAHISAITTGERNPSAVIAVKICEQLGEKFEKYFFIESVHKKKQNKEVG